jgi:hypothetical protein
VLFPQLPSSLSSAQPGSSDTPINLPRAAAKDWSQALAEYIRASSEVEGAEGQQGDGGSGSGSGTSGVPCIPQLQPSGPELLRVTGCMQVSERGHEPEAGCVGGGGTMGHDAG